MEVDDEVVPRTKQQQHPGNTDTTSTKVKTKASPEVPSDPYTATAISYSPLGMVLAPPASAVQTFLPDPSGIYHYHRPPIVSLSMEPRMSREVERIRTLTRALGARRMTHSGLRSTEHDLRQAALERVVRKLTLTMRSDSFGRQTISEQYRLALNANRRTRQQQPQASGSRERPTSSRITEVAWHAKGSEKGTRGEEDDDEWVSEDGQDSDEDRGDTLTRDALDLVRRVHQRSERRRIGEGGISKATSGRKTTGSLTAAYTRHMTDEQAVRRTVTEMGQGDPDAILRLLRTGVSANIRDSVGRTPLHVGCSCANVEGVRLLLHMGADANAVDRVGNTPLTIAATAALIDLVVPLLEAGADPQIGKGMVSAMAMVRSRLRLLRAHIRHARAAEKVAAEPTAARARRLHAVAVARQCVDIIHLLRLHSPSRTRPPLTAPETAEVSASVDGSSQPAVMAADASSELDALSSQLLSMGLEGESSQARNPSSNKGKEPSSRSAADNSNDGDDQIDGLLERFSRLLGDSEADVNAAINKNAP
ncbi:hypothetical protein EV178_006149 [Coemansia sp. RSA 1646]|nr:hypothetical protein EV178_006149 [Coemansia sp. RSA 1646]